MANFIIETLMGRFCEETMRNERRDMCGKCPMNDNGTCSSKKQGTSVITFDYKENMRFEGQIYNGCGCNIKWKTSLINEKCPLGKWL